MKKVLALAALPLITAACSGGGGEVENSPPKSDRGNIIKQVGETAGYGVDRCGGEDCVSFVVTSIEPSAPCDFEPLEPAKGDVIAVHLSIDTRPDVPEDMLLGIFQSHNWAVVDAEGTTHNNSSGEIMPPCDTDPNGLGEIRPGSHYEGVLNFDVPNGSKIMILDMFGNASWEWQIPA